MAEPIPPHDTSLDRLWKEYGRAFQEFDDLTLARWCAQTLGQLHGKAWRASHPLVGAFKLAAQIAHERRLWLQKLVNIPHGYHAAPCCRAPFLPLFTRDVAEHGLLCQHCNEPLVPFEDLPTEIQADTKRWAEAYQPVHEVAHWNEKKQATRDYDAKYEKAAQKVEDLLAEAATTLVPRFLDHYPAILWEDQDECLEVRPEDIEL